MEASSYLGGNEAGVLGLCTCTNSTSFRRHESSGHACHGQCTHFSCSRRRPFSRHLTLMSDFKTVYLLVLSYQCRIALLCGVLSQSPKTGLGVKLRWFPH